MIDAADSADRPISVLPGDERRRSQRVIIRVSVTLYYSENDQDVRVVAQTNSVNDHGALLLCPRSFPADAQFVLEHNRTGQRQGCHVVRAPVDSPDGFYVAVEFDAPATGFWQITFPPINTKATSR